MNTYTAEITVRIQVKSNEELTDADILEVVNEADYEFTVDDGVYVGPQEKLAIITDAEITDGTVVSQ